MDDVIQLGKNTDPTIRCRLFSICSRISS